MSPTTRLTAEERREEIVAAARIEFAAGGFAGTSTESIAQRAGVSQPYLFQLFRSKKDLFIAAVCDCFARTARAFEESGRKAGAAGLGPTETLHEMGHGYVRLLMADPETLRLQLHAYAASNDPEIRATVRTNYASLWQLVQTLSGAPQEELVEWFAQGMLINVVAAIGEGASFDDYLSSLLGGPPTAC